MHSADVEAIAQRVAELLRERSAPSMPPTLLTAAEVARRFGLSRDFVYEHADRLGALRLGDGPKPRLRFDAERVTVALNGRSAGVRSGPVTAPSQPEARARRRRAPDSGPEILSVFASNEVPSAARTKAVPARRQPPGTRPTEVVLHE
jgi:hypothetical protein